MSIGSRIKECRENIGLTQTELAELLGVSKGAIGNYEAGIGYPKVENMRKLFEVLKTDANYLFQDEVALERDSFNKSEKSHFKKIGDRIKERRTELGLTQAQLSTITQIKTTTISNYENHISSPNDENLYKLMAALKCDANYLFEWKDGEAQSFSLHEKTVIKKYRELDTHGKKIVDIVLNEEHTRCKEMTCDETKTFLFRRLSKNKASAGGGYDLSNADEWREITVVDTPEAREADFAVEIDGDSMEPTYHDGDIVYIRIAPQLEVGEVGLFIQNGNGYIKEAGNDRLISHNRARKDVFPSDGEIRCIGRVIGVAEFV